MYELDHMIVRQPVAAFVDERARRLLAQIVNDPEFPHVAYNVCRHVAEKELDDLTDPSETFDALEKAALEALGEVDGADGVRGASSALVGVVALVDAWNDLEEKRKETLETLGKEVEVDGEIVEAATKAIDKIRGLESKVSTLEGNANIDADCVRMLEIDIAEAKKAHAEAARFEAEASLHRNERDELAARLDASQRERGIDRSALETIRVKLDASRTARREADLALGVSQQETVVYEGHADDLRAKLAEVKEANRRIAQLEADLDEAVAKRIQAELALVKATQPSGTFTCGECGWDTGATKLCDACRAKQGGAS